MTVPQKQIVRDCYAEVFYSDDAIKAIAADGALAPDRTANLLDHCMKAAQHARTLHNSVIDPQPAPEP